MTFLSGVHCLTAVATNYVTTLKATAKAIANGGFWGPWLKNGTIGPPPAPPAPPAPPVPPQPPSAGFALKFGPPTATLCLTISGLPPALGACDGGSKWEVVSAGDAPGAVRTAISSAKENAAYIRHHPPGGTCAVGTPLILGEATTTVYSEWNKSSMQLQTSDCTPAMCFGPVTATAGSAIVLFECSNTAATTWTN
jgi:hypothetical protein